MFPTFRTPYLTSISVFLTFRTLTLRASLCSQHFERLTLRAYLCSQRFERLTLRASLCSKRSYLVFLAEGFRGGRGRAEGGGGRLEERVCCEARPCRSKSKASSPRPPPPRAPTVPRPGKQHRPRCGGKKLVNWTIHGQSIFF